MAELKHRLAQYAALSAAIPAAGAHAGVIAQTNLGIVINPGESAFIDFGAGFGEVFRFELRTQFTSDAERSTVSVVDYYNAFFQFNPGNGNVNAGGFIGTGSSSGGSSSGNDPRRLGFGESIGTGRGFYEPMSTQFSTQHDIANMSFGSFYPTRATYGYGSWFPDARGYIGFKMFKDGSFHFGWFDVETRNWATAARNGAPELIIHGWGFDDAPRAAINAGDVPAPAAGGLLALAMGAAGLRRARRVG